MNWSLCLMGDDGSGGLQHVDVLSMGSIEPPVGLDDVGIGREQGREFLAALQAAVVTLQEAALRSSALKRVAASPDVKLKDYRARKVQTLFGTVSFRKPRIIDHGRIETVLPMPSNGRSTQEFDELRSKIIAPHLKQHPDEPKSAARQKRVKKLRATMKKLEKYVANPEARIVDYCSRKLESKRLGTSLVEGAADFIVNARMARSQHMRWTKRGAYNILQVRTADINQRLRESKLAA